jgi:hypothetical protein
MTTATRPNASSVGAGVMGVVGTSVVIGKPVSAHATNFLERGKSIANARRAFGSGDGSAKAAVARAAAVRAARGTSDALARAQRLPEAGYKPGSSTPDGTGKATTSNSSSPLPSPKREPVTRRDALPTSPPQFGSTGHTAHRDLPSSDNTWNHNLTCGEKPTTPTRIKIKPKTKPPSPPRSPKSPLKAPAEVPRFQKGTTAEAPRSQKGTTAEAPRSQKGTAAEAPKCETTQPSAVELVASPSADAPPSPSPYAAVTAAAARVRAAAAAASAAAASATDPDPYASAATREALAFAAAAAAAARVRRSKESLFGSRAGGGAPFLADAAELILEQTLRKQEAAASEAARRVRAAREAEETSRAARRLAEAEKQNAGRASREAACFAKERRRRELYALNTLLAASETVAASGAGAGRPVKIPGNALPNHLRV